MLSGLFQGNLIPLYSLEKINCFHNALGLVSSYQGYTQGRAEGFFNMNSGASRDCLYPFRICHFRP